MKTIVFSVGGSLIAPDDIDRAFVRRLKTFTLSLVRRNTRVAIITGGGKVCRRYQDAASSLVRVSNEDLDWIGIASTRLNAELLRSVFGSQAYERVIGNPSSPIRTTKKILIGAGYEPGASSDIDAILLAKNLKAATVVNLSNIDYVYDKDPRTHKDAKKKKELTWDGLLKITGRKWTPGLNAPFDPTAAMLAQKLGLSVVIMNGKRLEEFTKFLAGRAFRGTIIRG